MTTQTPKEKALEVLIGAKVVLEFVAPLIKAAGIPPMARKIGVMRGIGTSGAHKIKHIIHEIDVAITALEADKPTAIEGLDEAIKKSEEMLTRITMVEFVFAENGRKNPDENIRVTKDHIRTLISAARLYAQGATQTQRKTSVDVRALKTECIRNTADEGHIRIILNVIDHLAARYDFIEKEGK